MRVLVTGGAGFIGSHLCDALLARGDEVLAVDDLSTGKRENLVAAWEAGLRLEIADITEPGALLRAADSFVPEAIVHLAAQMDVRRSVADPAYDARVNVVGTVNVLELATHHTAPVAFASTGGVIYGEGLDRGLPFEEDTELLPESPYGISKLAGERYAGYYRAFRGIDAVTFRLGNVYGPRQDPHGEAGVVSIFCGCIRDGRPPTIFGDGEQLRDYVYIDDVVEALVMAVDAMVSAPGRLRDVYNVGTGEGLSVLELANRLFEAAGRTDLGCVHAPARAGELQAIYISPERIAADLGWRASTALGDGLSATLRWALSEAA